MSSHSPAQLFSSDWHLGHAKIAELRGYAHPDDHDSDVLSNFSAAIQDRLKRFPMTDTVDFFFLGDLTSGSSGQERRAVEIVYNLKQHWSRAGVRLNWHAICGNHDSWWPAKQKAVQRQMELIGGGVFDTVNPYVLLRFLGTKAYLSHFPWLGGGDRDDEERYPNFRLGDTGDFLLHGHTHLPGRIGQGGRMIHVGLDAWDMKPVTFDQITALIVSMQADEMADDLYRRA